MHRHATLGAGTSSFKKHILEPAPTLTLSHPWSPKKVKLAGIVNKSCQMKMHTEGLKMMSGVFTKGFRQVTFISVNESCPT